MKIVCVCLFFVTLLACRDGRGISEELSVLQSQPIVLPQEKDVVIHNADTVFNIRGNKLKYIIYNDSLACTSCMINNLISWNPLIEYSKNYKGGLVFYFIFSPAQKDLRLINMFIKNSEFKYRIIVDERKTFARLNPHLPKNHLLHSFLLDENDNVILVGNPLRNKKIEEIFYKIVEERLGKSQPSSAKED